MNGTRTGPSVADLASMSTEERMAGMEHSEVRYFTRYVSWTTLPTLVDLPQLRSSWNPRRDVGKSK